MYDSEDNHILVRDMLDAFSVIPARYEQYMYQYEVQVGDTEKNKGSMVIIPNCCMGQRNKDETIISVIKRLFGEHITSRLVRTQNRDLSQMHSLKHA
jgi:hypothetical protein